ncbi:hypothetical protein M514_16410 [Trichuris suis]|uniref:C2H2-type domain-containing protein n=1 Tax=Trichuris suis TaxID=68888 RepID=A0A085NPT2_9BILA|nr:hypothetical protein M514_16410 [Trichuris suis]
MLEKVAVVHFSKLLQSSEVTGYILVLPGGARSVSAYTLVGPERLPDAFSVANHNCEGPLTILTDQGRGPRSPRSLIMESAINATPQHDPERTAGGDGAEIVAATYPGPFRCPLCWTVNSVGHLFIEHMRSHGRVVTFLCGKCGRSCPTVYSVACHYSKCGRRVTRRQSRPPVAVEERARSMICPVRRSLH